MFRVILLYTITKALVSKGNFIACKIISDYYSEKEPHHRRKVEWLSPPILKTEISQTLKSSLQAQNTLIDISKHSEAVYWHRGV